MVYGLLLHTHHRCEAFMWRNTWQNASYVENKHVIKVLCQEKRSVQEN